MSHATPQDQPGEGSSNTPVGPSPAAPVEPPPPGPHVARADRVFRTKRGLLVVALVGFGLWSAWHGFVTWPRETAEFERIGRLLELVEPGSPEAVQLREQQKGFTHRSGSDILFNKVFALLLPLLGLLLLAQSLYVSRGEIRLDESDTLHAPGHAPIPLSIVKGLDDARWRRKGISYVEYEGPEGPARVRLDHDPYEPIPIRAIHDRLAYLLSQRAANPAR